MTLRILVIMDPFIRVPPAHYGGIERVVAEMTSELCRRGHAVTLWAAPGSASVATVQPFGREGEWTARSNARNVALLTARLWRMRGRFDVVHNFGRLAYLAGILRAELAKVQTYMRPVSRRNIRLVDRWGARRLRYTAVSEAIRDTADGRAGQWRVIYNGAHAERYTFRGDVDTATAPLVYVGRLDRCKGVHTAIAVARRLKRRLIIAGTISDLAHERDYFDRELRPHLDARLITYVGPVDDKAKNELLGQAAALLLPVEWEEPFPVVLPEAMLCGTPVIAFRRGGLPEGIDHGATGFLCETADDMAHMVERLGELDRGACRAVAEHRFSTTAIVGAYEELYRDLIA